MEVAKLDPSRPSIEEVGKAHEQDLSATGLLDALASLFPTWRLLAEGAPVPVTKIAQTLGKSLGDVRADLSKVEQSGYFGVDDDGNIINFFGLLLSPTAHSVLIEDRLLYAG